MKVKIKLQRLVNNTPLARFQNTFWAGFRARDQCPSSCHGNILAPKGGPSPAALPTVPHLRDRASPAPFRTPPRPAVGAAEPAGCPSSRLGHASISAPCRRLLLGLGQGCLKKKPEEKKKIKLRKKRKLKNNNIFKGVGRDANKKGSVKEANKFPTPSLGVS